MPDSGGRFVYGMRVTGLDDVVELRDPIDGPVGGSLVHVTQSARRPPPPIESGADRVVRVLLTGHVLELDRSDARATFFGPHLSPDQLAHPYLGPVAVAFNRWAGREVFHAAAFVADAKAWVVLGPRTAGKSTLTAALSAASVEILADDIVVTDGATVFSGPRCIDLRDPIPEDALTGSALSSGPARLGTRRRVVLPPTLSAWPLGGWFFLGWADQLSIEPLSISAVLNMLSAGRCAPGMPSDPGQLLTLAGFPGWVLRRPKSWSRLPDTVETLVTTAVSGRSRSPERMALR